MNGGSVTATAESLRDVRLLLRLHERSKNNKITEIITCDVCGVNVKGEQGLKIHKALAHGINGPQHKLKRVLPKLTPSMATATA